MTPGGLISFLGETKNVTIRRPGMARRLKDGEVPMTLESYERLPHDDSFRDEVVRGRLVREPVPAGEHGWLEVRLGHHLYMHVERHGLGVVLGCTGYILASEPLTLRAPDLSFVAHARVHNGYPMRTYSRVAPDLAVEIVSPSNRRRELEEKVRQFLEAGTRAVWVVDPIRRCVTVHGPGSSVRLEHGEVLDGGDVVPGFSLPVDELFAT
jgi:Uma2 family endonuclease